MRYAIGGIEIDDERLSVLKNGRKIPAQPKVIETLAALCAESGRFVSKASLIARVWRDGYADDATVWQKIHLARKLLHDHAGEVRIETLAGRGYRLVVSEPRLSLAATRTEPHRLLRAAAIALLCALACGGIFASARRATPVPAALAGASHRDYALGEHFLNQATTDALKKAAKDFAATVALSPGSPLGYAGLADSYAMLSLSSNRDAGLLQRSLRYARRAVDLGPESAQAQASYGFVEYVLSFRGPQADRSAARRSAVLHFSHALSIEPNYARARLWLGEMLVNAGDLRAGREQLERAVDLEPALPSANVWLAFAAYLNGDVQAADTYASAGIGFATPDEEDALLLLGLALEREHRLAAARETFVKLARYSHALGSVMLADVDAQAGRTNVAAMELRAALQNGGCRCTKFWVNVAHAEVHLGRIRDAAAYARRARTAADPSDAWRFL